MTTNPKQVFNYLLCAGIITLVITACKKEKSSDKQQEITAEQVKATLNNELFVNRMFNGSLQNQSKAKAGGRLENRVEDMCPGFALSVDSIGGFRITLGFDFGNGCPNDIAAGIVRKGKVEYSYQFTNNAVSIVKAKYINFTDALTNYNGQLALVYQYTPAAGNAFFAGTDGLNINNSFYGTALYKAALTFKQKQGMSTPFNYADDVYELTGTSSAQTSNAGTITAEITKPLINTAGCVYIVSGTIKYNFNGAEALVDFGNGECDNKGTITIYGITYPFTF